MSDVDRAVQRVLAESFHEIFRRAESLMGDAVLEIWLNAFLSAAAAFAVRRFGSRAAYAGFQRIADTCAEDIVEGSDAAGC